MAKPLPKRVGSDDCAVSVDGEVYYPHEGEWVEMFAGVSVGELQAMEHVRQLGVRIDAVKGEPGEYAKALELLDPHYDELYAHLTGRLVAWSWTDDRGRPLGPPDDPATLKRLRPEELYYLLFAAQGETTGQRKNGFRPSPTTSSATGSPATGKRKSAGGHSRSPAS